jgi:hypothetical protein
MKSHLYKLTSRFRQAGITLLETTVALALMAASTIAYLSAQTMTARVDQGKVVGAQYARFNTALGQYMALHHGALKSLPPACSQHGLASVTSLTKPNGLACSVKVNETTTVFNGLQPTPAELASLGLLPAGYTGELSLRFLTTISEPRQDGTAVTGNYTPPRLLAVVSQACVAVPSTLTGRYVLVRRKDAGTNLSMDEVEVIVNGSNIASSAAIKSSAPYFDNRQNSLAYYSSKNLVDRLVTTISTNGPYVTTGLFRSVVTSPSRAWVQLDLGWQREISSIGLRSAQGPTTTSTLWPTEGANPVVEVSNKPVNESTGLFDPSTVDYPVRKVELSGLVPGTTNYVSNENFTAAPTANSLIPTDQGCLQGSQMVLSSLIFNTQPFALPNWQGSGALLATVAQSAGVEALMSDPVAGGELKTTGMTLPNPLRYYNPDAVPPDSTGAGVGGIIAVRNGYDSLNTSGLTTPDGKNMPTAAWNFNNNDLTGVNNFESATATVRGNLAAQGAISASTVSANQASFSDLKLSTAIAGGICSSSAQSVALSNASQLMTCVNNVWTSVLTKTVNGSVYHKVQLIKEASGAHTPNHFYCVDGVCVNSAQSPIPSALLARTGDTYPTDLKITEWVPVVGSVRVEPSSGTVSTYHNVKEDSREKWSVDINASNARIEVIMRFYKINP